MRGGVGSRFLANASQDLAVIYVRDAGQPNLGRPLLLLVLQGVNSGKSQYKTLSIYLAFTGKGYTEKTIRTNRQRVLYEELCMQ